MHARAANRTAARPAPAVLVLTVFTALAAWLLGEPAEADATASRMDAGERAVVRTLNRQRARHGLRRLRGSRKLQRAADAHCRDMLRADFFGHTSSDGTSMTSRVQAYRRSDGIGETLAYLPRRGQRRAARTVVRMWMNSPGHRAAILSPDFRRVGVARRTGRLGRRKATVYTADFATRR